MWLSSRHSTDTSMNSYEKDIEDYLNALLEVNNSINLTRITDDSDARLLHIEDSLSGLKELNAAPDGLYGDLGSGGGFPGVPLALASGRETILIDSVQKKMKAVQGILNQLGLNEKINVYAGRIEELSLEKPNQFSVLTARALAPLPSLLELAAPLLRMNGVLICYKAPMDSELDEALSIQDKLGFELKSRRDFTLSDNETNRCILVFEKVKNPSMKLPRRIGLAQKKPLSNL